MKFTWTLVWVVGCVVGSSLLQASAPPVNIDILKNVLECCLTIECGDSTGSGVVVRRGDTAFVWTAAHVVSESKSVNRVFDARTGKEMVKCSFADVMVNRDDVQEGRKVGTYSALARVVRYSERHDLALLRLHKKGWPARGTSFSKEVPVVGQAVWHVGSISGERGANSVSWGHVAAVGRLRLGFRPDSRRGLVYDQCTAVVHPGSSGGGVFRTRDGECLGIITEFLGPAQTAGATCMVPGRRIHEFARTARCTWAVTDVAIPCRDDEPVLQDDLRVELPVMPRVP